MIRLINERAELAGLAERLLQLSAESAMLSLEDREIARADELRKRGTRPPEPLVHLYGAFTKIDTERQEAFGYASTPRKDQQGEIITLDAIRNALPEYLKFPAVRAMHQPVAAGYGIEATVDQKGLWFGAKVTDPDAWQKVKTGTYRGFSIGGRVTARDPVDRTIVKGIELVEISLVDRPCNPDATFELIKRGTTAAQDQLRRRAIRARLTFIRCEADQIRRATRDLAGRREAFEEFERHRRTAPPFNFPR